MKHSNRTSAAFLAALLLSVPVPARAAGWSINLGYQNPAVSTWGLNFLNAGQTWGFEVGIGWIDIDSTEDDKKKKKDEGDDKDEKGRTTIALAGDVDVKYFLSSGGARPYLQGGFGFGFGIGAATGDDAGASAGTGSGFVGIGLLAGGDSLYLYVAGNVSSNENTFVQAGIGTSL